MPLVAEIYSLNPGKPFKAQFSSNSSSGYFLTAEEAALCYARHLGQEAALNAHAAYEAARAEAEAQAAQARRPPPPPPPTEAEVIALAEADGLTLSRAKNQSGFTNVTRSKGAYDAREMRKGHSGYGACLARFETAPEAALYLARRESESRVRHSQDTAPYLVSCSL